ncbi:MAG: hypothetical protein IKQ45_01205 [Clostridia bacterium]|nr:hypothetical protein [Clostridia bacterium]
MNKLREELQEMLRKAGGSRPAVLRRSRRDDYLYATDLPLAAGKTTADAFIRTAEKAGWRTEVIDGWIQLDRESPRPPEGGFRGPYGPEAGCCASLLCRHAKSGGNPGSPERRRLIKAGEEGAEAYEKACAAIHREWAEALRRGECLPDLDEEYFTGGGITC